MEYVILPKDEIAYLHQLINLDLVPLGPVPGLPDADYFIARDHASYAFIDQAGKRIGFYKILTEPPYYETLIPPTTLPRNCRADCLLIHKNAVYIGGGSKQGECLWKGKPGDRAWRSVALPPEMSAKRNKSIDGLFIDNDRLIAVDNLVIPKWILIYDIANFDDTQYLEKFKLQWHTSYERILFGAASKYLLALFSAGFNHGEASCFLSLLNKKTFEELRYWFVSPTHSPKEDYRYCITDEIENILGKEAMKSNRYFLFEHDDGHSHAELMSRFKQILEDFPAVFCGFLGVDASTLLEEESTYFGSFSRGQKQLRLFDDDELVDKYDRIQNEKESIAKKAITKLRCKKIIKRMPGNMDSLPRVGLTQIVFNGNYLLIATERKLYKLDIRCFLNSENKDYCSDDLTFKPVFLKKVRRIDKLIISECSEISILIFGCDKYNQAVYERVRIDEQGS